MRIKKLYIFMVKTFLPLLAMTSMICLFIVIMQFLWRHIDDLVGKGLSIAVVGELLFYSALSLLPMALPLAVLLASLMTFGNLGEHVELTAMKSSGISLMKIMSPLVVLMSLLAAGLFVYQDTVVPRAQVQMWTLLFSMRQKSPTLDIPEGTVYTQIPGYNLYVGRKSAEGGMLYDLLIYDVTTGVGFPRIVAADSGRLDFTPDMRHLRLELMHGNWYEDMRGGGTTSLGNDLYRREEFEHKTIMIPYDNTFTRMDDDAMRQQYVGKDIAGLRHTIDSVHSRLDSIGGRLTYDLRQMQMVGVPLRRDVQQQGRTVQRPVPQVGGTAQAADIDSLLSALSPGARVAVIEQAIIRASNVKQDVQFKGFTVEDDGFVMRRHEIELQKKYTLALACLIFFFIGAPLGAIIRKGGLGTPVVVSVLLFIVYYIFDNTGYKLARDGRWAVWQGIWLSSALLMPLGVFLTQKAVNDSAVFNPDAWLSALRRLGGLHQTRKLTMKEVIINEVDNDEALRQIAALRASCENFLTRYPGRQSYTDYLRFGYDKALLRELALQIDNVVDYLSNSRDQMVLNKAMDFPVVRGLLTYHLTNHPHVGTLLAVLLPIGVPLYLVGQRHQANLRRDVRQAVTTCDQLTAILQGHYTRELEYNP